MQKCQAVQEEHTTQLLKKQGVQGTAIGKKWVDGKPTEEDAVLIFVQKKHSAKSISDPNVLTKFSADDLIPKHLNGIPTDIIEVGDVVKQAGFKRRVRPIKPGYSIGHGKITAGTIGGIFIDRNGDPVILSNNHVLANENNAKAGDLIYQPGPTDSRGLRGQDIATLKRFLKLKRKGNLHDSATAKIHSKLIRDGLLDDTYPQINSRLTGFGNPSVGMQVQKCGRTTGYTTGRILGINASFTIQYDFGNAQFDKCVVLTAMSKGGDSGSIIQDMNERAVALLFAGSPKVTIASPMSIVRDHYGLKLYSNTPNKAGNSVNIGNKTWAIRKSGPDTVKVVDKTTLHFSAAANRACCTERAISSLKSVQCTVNTGTDSGSTWGTGLSVHWPNGNIKINLRHNGAFGGYVNGAYNISIGKVKAGKDYDLRIRSTNNTYVGEVRDSGKWYKIIEVPHKLFPHRPTMIRVGKTDINGNVVNHSRSGPIGKSVVKNFSHK